MRNFFWIYAIAVWLIISITIVFLNGELLLNYSLKINDQKVANFATTIGAVISSITLFLLVKQLGEMESARKSEHKPYMFFTTEQLKYSILQYNGLLGEEWVKADLDKFEGSQSPFKPKLKITNAGKGIALEVRVVWNFDKREVDDLLKNGIPQIEWESLFDLQDNNNTFSVPPNGTYSINSPYKYLLWLVRKGASGENPLCLTIYYQDIFGEKTGKVFEISGFVDSDTMYFDASELKV